MNKTIYPTVHLSIDMEKGFFEVLGEACMTRMTRRANRFIAALRRYDVPTVLVGTDTRKYTPVQFYNEETPHVGRWDKFTPTLRTGDMFCYKRSMSAMQNPLLVQQLKEWETGHVIVSGVYTGMCVAATAKDVLSLGLQCTIPLNLVAQNASFEIKNGVFPHLRRARYDTPEVSRFLLWQYMNELAPKNDPKLETASKIVSIFRQQARAARPMQVLKLAGAAVAPRVA